MTERGILFSAPMVRALLDGTKTQTRRVMRARDRVRDSNGERVPSPYGVPGDRLWVRETWCQPNPMAREVVYRADIPAELLDEERQVRREVGSGAYAPWRPSIFMPRWASRITLEVTDVRVQRVQDISESDAAAEGVPGLTGYAGWNVFTEGGGMYWRAGVEPVRGVEGVRDYVASTPLGALSARERYASLWQDINGKRPGCAWRDNPYIWAITFGTLEGE